MGEGGRERGGSFCVKTEATQVSHKDGELGKVVISFSLAVRRVGIWGGFSDLVDSKLVSHRELGLHWFFQLL